MKIFITKYALTRGILEEEAEEAPRGTDMVYIPATGDAWAHTVHKPYWHASLEDAVSHAETMREKKVKSLEKQVERLRLLRFPATKDTLVEAADPLVRVSSKAPAADAATPADCLDRNPAPQIGALVGRAIEQCVKLKWSLPLLPTEECPHEHIRAETPFGPILLLMCREFFKTPWLHAHPGWRTDEPSREFRSMSQARAWAEAEVQWRVRQCFVF